MCLAATPLARAAKLAPRLWQEVDTVRVEQPDGLESLATGEHRLLDRLEGSTQLEDRRSAIAEFNELTASEPVRLIDKGMAVLVQLLREEDTQLTRDVLETRPNLMDPEVPRGVVAETGQVKAVHNASVFLGNDSHLLDVLNSSEDGELYVRFHAVQVVMKLLSLARRQTQDAVLNQPTRVTNFLALMQDKREIVRNEVLLLLATLGDGNTGLQSLLAFQGAFDQLIKIIEGELQSGESGAAAVVNDCFAIVSSLLSSSAAARRLFREEGFLQRVLPMLRLPPAHSREHARTARLACALLALLVKGMDADAAEAQEAAAGSGVVADVVALLTDPATATDPALRVQALATLAARRKAVLGRYQKRLFGRICHNVQ